MNLLNTLGLLPVSGQSYYLYATNRFSLFPQFFSPLLILGHLQSIKYGGRKSSLEPACSSNVEFSVKVLVYISVILSSIRTENIQN